MKLDGAVEISIQLGLADAIADVVSSGRTLRQHGLQIIGEAIATSQATLIEREKRHDRAEDAETTRLKKVFADRLQGVVVAREYLMMDFDCPEGLLEAVEKVALACRRRRSRRCRRRAGSRSARWCAPRTPTA